MFAPERLRAIETLVRSKGRLTVGEVAAHVGASEITTRRDLRVLEAEGKVVRAHGGVLHPDYLGPEPHFERKAVEAVEVKARLAHATVAHLPERGQVFVDAGTTCLEVGRLLLGRRDLTIVTNSVPLLQLGGEANATVIGIGGEVRATSLALVGGFALDWLKPLRFEAAVIGASGLDAKDGASTTELSEAAVKQLACARSARSILVAHAAKWDVPAAVAFAAWERFNVFVTDTPVPAADGTRLRRSGLKIEIVSES